MNKLDPNNRNAKYRDSGAVFGSRESPVTDYKNSERPGEPDVLEWDFVLAAAGVCNAVPA
jgi:hypothetical protein